MTNDTGDRWEIDERREIQENWRVKTVLLYSLLLSLIKQDKMLIYVDNFERNVTSVTTLPSKNNSEQESVYYI